MSVLIEKNRPQAGDGMDMVTIIGAIGFLLVAFLLMPGDIASKSHLALHGLCAQRPSHSISLGGDALPFDARMTGIYLGAVTMMGWLAVVGRLRRTGRPPTSVILLLAVGVAAMAGDGVVGLLRDLHLPHPYAPSNLVRLATGMGAGIALGTGLCHLFATTVWARPDRQRALIGHVSELLAPSGVLAAIGALALSGFAVFFTPLALGLVAAALVVVTMLNVSLVLLVTGRAWSVHRLAEIRGTLLVGILLAVLVIGSMASARLAAEHAGLLPQLT